MRPVHSREDAGVVHQYVQAAETVRGGVNHGPHRGGVGEIGLYHDVTVARQGADQLLGQRPGVPMVHGHPITAGRESGGDGAADTSRRAGHQDGPCCHEPSVAPPILELWLAQKPAKRA
jgi:hypothetical protein